MPSSYTYYWKNETWNYNREENDDSGLLVYAGGNQFSRRGVKAGDTVYVVTNLNGELYMCGKMVIDGIYNAKQAAKLLGWKPADLWKAGEHIVAVQATPTNFHLKVPKSIARALLFECARNQRQSLVFDAKGKLDNQTLRGVRKLTIASAIKLNRLLPDLENVFDESTDPILLPDEVSSSEHYFEGAVKTDLSNRYERDGEAREACLAHYGHSCFICGFNFGQFYGSVGEGLIHVHHLTPLSQIGKEYCVDPRTDLRPVCPNCHTMIHRKNPPYSIEEMKAFLPRPSSMAA